MSLLWEALSTSRNCNFTHTRRHRSSRGVTRTLVAWMVLRGVGDPCVPQQRAHAVHGRLAWHCRRAACSKGPGRDCDEVVAAKGPGLFWPADPEVGGACCAPSLSSAPRRAGRPAVSRQNSRCPSCGEAGVPRSQRPRHTRHSSGSSLGKRGYRAAREHGAEGSASQRPDPARPRAPRSPCASQTGQRLPFVVVSGSPHPPTRAPAALSQAPSLHAFCFIQTCHTQADGTKRACVLRAAL